MTIEALARLRDQLAPLIEAAEAEAEQAMRDAAIQARAEAEAMERAAAQAIEALTGDNATRAAYEQGRRDERLRIMALITEQGYTLGRSGVNSLSLQSLKRRIQEAA